MDISCDKDLWIHLPFPTTTVKLNEMNTGIIYTLNESKINEVFDIDSPTLNLNLNLTWLTVGFDEI